MLMIKKHLSIFGAAALALCTFSGVVFGFGEPVVAKGMTMAEATKKFPPPKGGYPTAVLTTSSGGFVPSPFNSGRMMDTSDCKRGQPCLDPMANKVFLKP